jgi:hypothetical protein
MSTFYCQCGCGAEVGVWKDNNRRYGQVKGEPKSYVHNHHPKTSSRPINPNRKIVESREYRRIVERILGRPLPPKAVVHHVDENRFNNVPSNFVVCPDEAYHRMLHQRMRALREGGNANFLKCKICKKWDAPTAIKHARHPKCHADRERNRRYPVAE